MRAPPRGRTSRYPEHVTRIISGRAGGIALNVPGSGTRPTSDRIRESLFGALESADALRDARVLDLYAGSGALAFESVSRGAASADLVESAGPAAAIIRGNADRVAKSIGRAAPLRVHKSTVGMYLAHASDVWDLVFLDPPYDLGDAVLAGDLAALVPHLAPDALVIIERSSRSHEPPLPPELVIDRSKSYGDTTLWWAVPA